MSTPRRRVAWACPLNLASSIGREGVRVAEGLAAKGYDVRLIATDYEWTPETPRRETALPVRHVSEVELPRLALDHDHVVVDVGDNFLNHAGVFPLLDSAPCLAVVHDAYLANLFNGWLWWRGSHPEEREREAVSVYGPAAVPLLRRRARGELELEEEAASLPMTEWIARRAAGCLAHSAFYVPRLLASCAGPVDVAGLAVESRGIAPPPARGPDDRFTLLTVGLVNPNKCADRVVEALAADDELRERVDYRLVGPVSEGERARLETLAATLGFTGLSIEGAASEAELNAALAASDAIACLRRPVLEGASGSVVEAMMAARPVMVADAGCYADLHDDTVFKVPADVPVPALTAALGRLLADPEGGRALGARAAAYAHARFSLEAYLEVLEPLMAATARGAPLLRVGRAVSERLADLGLDKEDPAAARIASRLEALFAPA